MKNVSVIIQSIIGMVMAMVIALAMVKVILISNINFNSIFEEARNIVSSFCYYCNVDKNVI